MTSASLFSFALVASFAATQVGGGSAAFGSQRGQSGAEIARAAELAKRNVPNNDGRFIDAAILINVEADEYVAMFGVSQEGKTLELAQEKMAAAVASFSESLNGLKIAPADRNVDFVSQNRIYGFDATDPNLIRELIVGFEVKKTVSVKYRDKAMLDQLTVAASRAGIFDLVKVDYVIRDIGPVRKQLMAKAADVIKTKIADQETLLGMKVGTLSISVPGLVSTYYPVEMYDSYIAQESEEMIGYRQNVNVQRARKPRTFYYNPLTAKDFDAVINPGIVDPCVQVTIYVRVKY